MHLCALRIEAESLFGDIPLAHAVELVADLLAGLGRQQRHHDDGDARDQKRGQQLIDGERAAQRGEQVFPDEHHRAAGNHAGERAPQVAALPEQRKEHNRAEGGAKARPRKRHDGEHGAVRVPREQDAHSRHGDDREPRDPQRFFGAQLEVEHLLQQVLRDAGRGGEQLRVGGGHRGSQDAREHHAGQDGEERAVLAQQVGQLNDDGLAVGTRREQGHLAGERDAVADDADDDGHEHRDAHPDAGNAARSGEHLFFPDGHEAQQDVRHAEIAEAPRERGEDRQQAVGRGSARRRVVGKRHVQIAGQGVCIVHDGLPAACDVDAKEHDHDQCQRHDDALDQVGGGHGEEAAEHCVADDDDGADQHGHVVFHLEQAVEQRTHRLKAGRGIGHEEHEDDDGGDAGQDVPVVAVTAGEELRNGEGVARNDRVAPQALGHDQPVEVRANGEADGGPTRLCNAAQIGDARQSHEQPAAHVGCLGAHGRHERAQLAAAQIKFVCGEAAALFAVVVPHVDHAHQIDYDGADHTSLNHLPISLTMAWYHLPCRTIFNGILTDESIDFNTEYILYFSLYESSSILKITRYIGKNEKDDSQNVCSKYRQTKFYACKSPRKNAGNRSAAYRRREYSPPHRHQSYMSARSHSA